MLVFQNKRNGGLHLRKTRSNIVLIFKVNYEKEKRPTVFRKLALPLILFEHHMYRQPK